VPAAIEHPATIPPVWRERVFMVKGISKLEARAVLGEDREEWSEADPLRTRRDAREGNKQNL